MGGDDIDIIYIIYVSWYGFLKFLIAQAKIDQVLSKFLSILNAQW